MNRRQFIKSVVVSIPIIGITSFNIVESRKQPSYTFIRVITPGYVNKGHTWVIRSNNLDNPIIPTHRNYLPIYPPTKRKNILSNDTFGCFKIGDYYRYSDDIYSEWVLITNVQMYSGGRFRGGHSIGYKRIFPYNPNEPHHKSLYDSLKESPPEHQPV